MLKRELNRVQRFSALTTDSAKLGITGGVILADIISPKGGCSIGNCNAKTRLAKTTGIHADHH